MVCSWVLGKSRQCETETVRGVLERLGDGPLGKAFPSKSKGLSSDS